MDTKQKIYNFLIQQLESGALTYEDRITEQSLVEHLGVSRTPIREGLLMLVYEEFLEKEANKGYSFKKYTEKDVEDLYQIIGILDGKVAELTVDYLTDQDIAHMRFTKDSMDSAILNELYTKYNKLQSEFHQIYINRCLNKTMAEELSRYKSKLIGIDYSNIPDDNKKEVLIQTNQEHGEIIALFEKKDGQGLRNYLENVHWRMDNAKFDLW